MVQDTIITPREGGSGAWADLEPGAYRAQVQAIEDVGVSEVYPADGPRLKFTFALLDVADPDTGGPITLYKWCSQKLTTGQKQSNLWKWAVALGVPPQVGQPFATSALLNRECQVVVVVENAGSENQRTKIDSILPPAKAPLAQRLAPAPAAPAPVQQEQIGPCVVCDVPATAYTSKGKPVCDAHASV